MYGRYLIIASSALAFAGAAAAEPAKPAGQPEVKPAAQRPAEVVLASAEQIPAPATVTPAATPAKKPRAARVTSCRCAGQTPQNEQ